MTRILYRPLGSDCVVRLRPLPIDESTSRVIPVHRKPAWPHAALAVEYPHGISVGTLVELDVSFSTTDRRLRGRGVISWAIEGSEPDQPYKLGVVVYSLTQLEVPAAPMASSVQNEAPARRLIDEVQPLTQEATPPTARQDGPLAPAQQSVRDMALGATAAMLSPLQPLTAAPVPEEIAELLTNLLGEEVKVSRSGTALRQQDACMLGEYTSEDGEISAAAAVDLRLAIYLGSALAMIPSGAADSDVEAGKLSAEVRDNMQEIFNIATSLVIRPNGPHRKLGQVFALSAQQPTGALNALVSVPPFRYDFDVEVPGYGKGRLSYFSPALQIIDDDLAAARQPAPATPEPEPAGPVPRASSGPTSVRELPSESELADLLTSLLGSDVTVTVASHLQPREDAYVLADYVQDDGSLTGVCAADVKIANFLGAALAMIPANAAEKDARAKKLSDEMKDNLQEVFNVSTSLFDQPGGIKNRFRRLYLPHKEDLPSDVTATLDAPAARVDFDLDVPDYGAGKFVFFRASLKAAADSPVQPRPSRVPEPPSDLPATGEAVGQTPAVRLPDAQSFGDLLTGLVGEEVSVEARSEPLRPNDLVLVGSYGDDVGTERLACGFDLELANYLGAALAMIPAAAAQDDIDSKRISDEVLENVKEICNIASGALNQEGAIHVKLAELYKVSDGLPDAIAAALTATSERLDLDVEVPGYGSGKLAIIVLS